MTLIPGCAIILLTSCLLKSAVVAPSGGPCDCPCPDLPPHIRTEAAAAQDCCSNAGRHRYRCVAGYVRQAGTSNLAKCTKTENGTQQWSTADLVCIPDMTSTSGPDVVTRPRLQASATSIIHATEPSTYQMAGRSTADQGIGQPPYYTTYQPSTATPPGDPPAMTSTHADTPTGPPSGSASTLAMPRPTQCTPRDNNLQADPTNGGQGHSKMLDAKPDEHQQPEQDSGALVPAGISVMLLLVCASVGLGFYLWKRKINPESTPAELIPMMPMTPATKMPPSPTSS